VAVPVRRGGNVEFTREIPGLVRVVAGLSLDAGAETVLLDNLVMVALLCDQSGKIPEPESVVFFNQLTSPDESVAERQAALGHDAEQIEIDLQRVPAEVARIVLIVYVNEGLAAKRTLGQLRDCTVRLLNGVDNSEIVRSENMAPGFSNETAAVLAEVYRRGEHWRFKVVGAGYAQGIVAVARDYGLQL
jgi:tellurium resistance protein TerD